MPRARTVVWIGDRILRDAEFAGDNRVLRDLARAARRRLRRALRGAWPAYAIRLDPHPAARVPPPRRLPIPPIIPAPPGRP